MTPVGFADVKTGAIWIMRDINSMSDEELMEANGEYALMVSKQTA